MAGQSNSFSARFAQCVLNHAPISAYYKCFNINEPKACPCGAALETRSHILDHCPRFKRKGPIKQIHTLCIFLEKNPLAFAFKPSQEADEVGRHLAWTTRQSEAGDSLA